MSRIQIGEFEELVLLVVAIAQTEAYGVNVMNEIKSQTGRSINISAVHTALDRLEKKGFLKSTLGGATSERGGRRKRLFEITALGINAVEQVRDMRNTLFDQIPEFVLKK